MSPETLEALQALAIAIESNPDDRQMLRIYGNLPAHLSDIIDDFFEAEETEE